MAATTTLDAEARQVVRRAVEPVDGIGYVRVSKGRENMISPEIQEDAIRAYAAANNINIVKIIKDLDRSGRRFEKRAVGQIVQEIKQGQYETVVLWKWSRWGRNAQRSGLYLVQVEDVDGSVVSATEDIDVKTAIGRFTRTTMLALAELESDMKSDGWKETHAIRRKAGLPHSGLPRFGYEYAPFELMNDEGNTMIYKMHVPSKETGPVLTDLYDRYVNAKVSLYSLAMDLNARGIQTTKGGPWSSTSLGYVLDTGFAAGWIRERSPKAQKKGSKTLASFDQWRRGAHEPLISEELWQGFKDQRRENAKKPPRLHRPAHAMSGLVYCGICKTRMVVAYSGRNGEFLSWRCKRKMESGSSVCPGVMLSDKRTQQAVHDWCEEHRGGAGFDIEESVSLTRQKAAMNDAERIEERVEDLNRQKDRLLKLYMRGGVDDARYDEQNNGLTRDLEAAQFELRQVRAEEAGRQVDPTPLLEQLADYWEEVVDSEKKNRLLRQVVGAVYVYEGPWGPGKVSIVGRWEL